jgi:hypothetical protein
MQLGRREAIELVLSSQASLLWQVATRFSFEVKTTQPGKSYKNLWGSGSETPWRRELWQEEWQFPQSCALG